MVSKGRLDRDESAMAAHCSFRERSTQLAENVAFLITIKQLWMRARTRERLRCDFWRLRIDHRRYSLELPAEQFPVGNGCLPPRT